MFIEKLAQKKRAKDGLEVQIGQMERNIYELEYENEQLKI